jgi:hypothetical protein
VGACNRFKNYSKRRLEVVKPFEFEKYAGQMGTSKNWDKYGRKQRMADAASRPVDGPKLNDVFKALEFYFSNPERKAGNWVVLPKNLSELSNDELLTFKSCHRSKTCAIEATNYDKSAGDRLFRVKNEVVEMLSLTSCSKCKYAERY